MQNLNLPVLIYGAKEGCQGCTFYGPEWEKVKEGLRHQVRFVKFTCSHDRPPPKPLAKYMSWYPSILLAGPKSYFRCFTPEDGVNEEEFSDDYTIKAMKFNANETPDGFEYAHGENNAANTINWVRQIAPYVSQYDEPAPPRKYSHLFTQ